MIPLRAGRKGLEVETKARRQRLGIGRRGGLDLPWLLGVAALQDGSPRNPATLGRPNCDLVGGPLDGRPVLQGNFDDPPRPVVVFDIGGNDRQIAFCLAAINAPTDPQRGARRHRSHHTGKRSNLHSNSLVGRLATPMMEGRGRGVESFSRLTTPGRHHE